MKTIIAGSRSVTDKDLVYDILNNLNFEVTEVVCGMANGVDLLGFCWASYHDPKIKIKGFPADWDKHGKLTAGFIRNQDMANYAEALVLIWDGTSTGSLDMLKRARKRNLYIDLYDLSQQRLF